MTPNNLYSEGQVTLLVPNIEEAVHFYTVKLGLKLKKRYGNEFAVVEGPGLTIGLHPQAFPASAQTHAVSIGLGVASLEAAMQDLLARGIGFPAPIVEDPPVRIAHFEGPAGMPMYLVEQSGWR